jgi:hypothetical protein
MKEESKEKAKVVIGIDPDVDGSGVGIVNLVTKEVTKTQLRLPELVEYLRERGNVMVFIEAGWMNHGNYHLQNKGQWHASKIGEQIGRNHEVSKLIGEFCEYHGIPYRHVKPLAKCYSGRDGKITHEELKELVEDRGFCLVPRQTNQETRDAIRIAVVYQAYV